MTKKQKHSLVVRDLAQLEALVSPARHQIMRTLNSLGVSSIKEIAAQLERSPESLYYHVRALEAVGLLISAGTRRSNGRSEALYSTAAKSITTDPKSRSPSYLELLKRSASALLRLADRQLAAELDRQGAARSTRSISLRFQQVNACLTPAAAAQLAAKLDDVTRFLQENDTEGAEMISVTLASSPIGKRRT